jgi:multimeric flavodoxin WrbA
MKVLAIVGTRRNEGLISRMCGEILKGAAENGHQTELINLYDYQVGYCTGCWACARLGKCVMGLETGDEFELIFEKVKEAAVIILGSPCYWGNVSGIMKNFFDRHSGSAMYKPPHASQFSKMKFSEKLRTLVGQMKNFGAHPYLRGKGFIIVTAMTVPFPVSRLSGDLPQTVKAMRAYVANLKGKLIGKVIFTDTLFKFLKNKEKRIMKKAYKIGKKLG